jgi:hypothetical protein
MTIRVTLALLATLLAVAACGGGRGVRPGTEPTTVLEVDNQSFNDMNIYVVNGGQRIRLGRATGKVRTDLTIPRGVLTFARELQFEADPSGSRRGSVTNRIWVNPGDRVSMIITP